MFLFIVSVVAVCITMTKKRKEIDCKSYSGIMFHLSTCTLSPRLPLGSASRLRVYSEVGKGEDGAGLVQARYKDERYPAVPLAWFLHTKKK